MKIRADEDTGFLRAGQGDTPFGGKAANCGGSSLAAHGKDMTPAELVSSSGSGPELEAELVRGDAMHDPTLA
eukprot:CAMPEP_0115869546 /NCGR_PEP_ID=MMETSP0287-20121206/21866_1 /TAXON_ID=412157 /ORGANISM="Chrysochromulina rotalis, Strain UIO044" /LENGTH=71 /DNA_ID=CAMNT_0003324239 /DNA_START=714 /DNA_END=930 /DNA_ORIENTATION=-